MKRLALTVAALALLTGTAFARNFTVPASDPAALVTVPDNWAVEEIQHGYSAKSPDGDVVFYMEYATGEKNVTKMMATNDEWMAENKIRPKGKATEKEIELGGIKATVYTYDAKDRNGDTIVDFVLFPAGKNRVVMLTLWGSQDERDANKDDIIAIQKSVKALN